MPWTEDEAKLLRHEAFISEILEARQPDRESRKPRWQIFLESSVATALITVILGGWAGHLITTSVQEKTKERELALARQKEITSARLQTVRSALADIGEVVSGSEDLIVLTHPEFNPDRFEDKAKEQLEQNASLLQCERCQMEKGARNFGPSPGILQRGSARDRRRLGSGAGGR
jgi:hypothetical protein